MMNELETRIAQSIGDHMENLPVRPLPRRRLWHARLRRAASSVVVGSGIIVAAFAGYAVFDAQLDSVTEPAAAQGTYESSFKDLQDERPVASGDHEGARWSLFADRREYGSGAAAESLLCLKMNFGGVEGEQTCNSQWNEAPADGLTAPIWYFTTRGPSVIYGSAQEVVDSVELSADGRRLTARVYEAPADFGSTLDFFVGFVPPGIDSVHFVAKDAAGNELETRDLGPGTGDS